ncbi:9105_t:CDS:2 [Cetraspora pellucida]|uniref:9105_t:CDS:1 n=1 Tax=Cetraspora pellucida TaxID=1433469 RepID=A0ACA9JVT9_9GLOM|nr:9105_t:CDS:2 [Cetraspora pellucida]
MVFIESLVEEKIPVKALIDTTSKSNTISKCLYNKLEENYGLEGISGDDLIGKEIKCLDLQFWYKGKWRSLDGTEVIDFQIRKNPSFDLVLGRDWLWMREAKISLRFFLENCKCYAKIEIDGMSILLIEEDSRPTGDSSSHKTSFTKNNLFIAKQWDFVSKSMESKPGLAQEEVINIINKILSGAQDIKHQKSHRGIFHNIPSAPQTPRRLNDDVSKNSRAGKIKKYPKIDLSDGGEKLSIKTHLNNIWKSVYSIENDIEYGVFEKLRIIDSDSESMDSDWYDLDQINPRKNHVHVKKKKVVSSIRKHRKNKLCNRAYFPE